MCCLREQYAHRYKAWGWHRYFIVVNREVTMYSWLSGTSHLACREVFLQVNFIIFSLKEKKRKKGRQEKWKTRKGKDYTHLRDYIWKQLWQCGTTVYAVHWTWRNDTDESEIRSESCIYLCKKPKLFWKMVAFSSNSLGLYSGMLLMIMMILSQLGCWAIPACPVHSWS